MDSLAVKIMESKKDKAHPYRNELIEAYMPFIVKNISKTTGRYLSNENSEEFIIGLEAFNEAIDRYELSKGSFLNFATLVISSRVKDFLKQDKYYQVHASMFEGEEFESLQEISNIGGDLKAEIQVFIRIMRTFQIDIEDLVEKSPKHKKTREEIIMLGKQISKETEIVSKIYKKKKLPMAEIIIKFRETKKRLKVYRDFIIAIIVIYKEDLCSIVSYLNHGGDEYE